MKLGNTLALALLISALAACSSTKDPREANVFDVAFRGGEMDEETKRLQEELDDLKLKLNAEQATVADLERTQELLQQDVMSLEEEVRTMDLVIEDVGRKIEEMKAKNLASEQEIAEAQRQYEWLEKNMARLQQEDQAMVEERRKELTEIQGEVDVLLKLFKLRGL